MLCVQVLFWGVPSRTCSPAQDKVPPIRSRLCHFNPLDDFLDLPIHDPTNPTTCKTPTYRSTIRVLQTLNLIRMPQRDSGSRGAGGRNGVCVTDERSLA